MFVFLLRWWKKICLFWFPLWQTRISDEYSIQTMYTYIQVKMVWQGAVPRFQNGWNNKQYKKECFWFRLSKRNSKGFSLGSEQLVSSIVVSLLSTWQWNNNSRDADNSVSSARWKMRQSLCCFILLFRMHIETSPDLDNADQKDNVRNMLLFTTNPVQITKKFRTFLWFAQVNPVCSHLQHYPHTGFDKLT